MSDVPNRTCPLTGKCCNTSCQWFVDAKCAITVIAQALKK